LGSRAGDPRRPARVATGRSSGTPQDGVRAVEPRVWSSGRTDTAHTPRRAGGLKKGCEPLPSRSAEERTSRC
jgi:hypothetical protein